MAPATDAFDRRWTRPACQPMRRPPARPHHLEGTPRFPVSARANPCRSPGRGEIPPLRRAPRTGRRRAPAWKQNQPIEVRPSRVTRPAIFRNNRFEQNGPSIRPQRAPSALTRFDQVALNLKTATENTVSHHQRNLLSCWEQLGVCLRPAAAHRPAKEGA
jgi:hypothetical protein